MGILYSKEATRRLSNQYIPSLYKQYFEKLLRDCYDPCSVVVVGVDNYNPNKVQIEHHLGKSSWNGVSTLTNLIHVTRLPSPILCDPDCSPVTLPCTVDGLRYIKRLLQGGS